MLRDKRAKNMMSMEKFANQLIIFLYIVTTCLSSLRELRYLKHINTYFICVDSFVHCPCGHEEINGSCSELCWQLVQFTKLLHVVDDRVVFGGVFLCLL